ncbi:YMGG-like glycine zipper-containing protein [Thiorhodovibrio winogradskyi]|uniref:YMGG-like glycine zipper-containing protein n=1 Tax=Thiorhodovibrio winogradskyi TaxID=77007 RepID=UPI002E28C4D7|nr:YMGG-like glycine zipper-containing protein [Thiorhodovibrio winogradskyi]
MLAGCSTTTPQSRTGERVLGGAALGAAAGAAVGSQSANAGRGAAIGAGIGALGGAMYDADQKSRRAPPQRYRAQPYRVPNG